MRAGTPSAGIISVPSSDANWSRPVSPWSSIISAVVAFQGGTDVFISIWSSRWAFALDAPVRSKTSALSSSAAVDPSGASKVVPVRIVPSNNPVVVPSTRPSGPAGSIPLTPLVFFRDMAIAVGRVSKLIQPTRLALRLGGAHPTPDAGIKLKNIISVAIKSDRTMKSLRQNTNTCAH